MLQLAVQAVEKCSGQSGLEEMALSTVWRGGQGRCFGEVTVKQSSGWNEGGTWVLLEKNFPKEIVVEDKGQR